MSEDSKTMQERLGTILREGRLLAQDAGNRVASFARWAYRDVKRRLGWSEEAPQLGGDGPVRARGGETGATKAAGGSAGQKTTPEGYATGQLWQPRDASKKARQIVDIESKPDEYYVIWQPPQGGQRNRIKESSFTRWVRRENASVRQVD